MKAEQARAGQADPGSPGPGPTLALLLQAIPDAILAAGPGGRIVFANPAAAAVCEVASPAELIGRSIGEVAAGFEIANEAGAPLAPADLPSARALAGQASEQ